MIYVNDGINISISLEMLDGLVVLKLNNEEVGYFDEDGLNLLPECSIASSLRDEDGYLKIIRNE